MKNKMVKLKLNSNPNKLNVERVKKLKLTFNNYCEKIIF